jgi:hypothetical protein
MLNSISSISFEKRSNPKLLMYGVMFLVSAIAWQIIEATPIGMFLGFIPGIGLLKPILIVLFIAMIAVYYVTARRVLVIYSPSKKFEVSGEDIIKIAKLVRSDGYEKSKGYVSYEKK